VKTFREKRIWITGASTGIGAALAHELSNRGASLILTSRSRERLERVREHCNGPVSLLPFDLGDERTCRDAAERAETFYGGVDVFIGNAGISQRSLFEQTDYEVINRIISINLIANLVLVRSLLPGMKERKEGGIVLMSSIVGKFGSPLRSLYSASKHALHGFAESIQAELYQDNISVSVVVPGYVRTNISYHALAADGSLYNRLDPGQESGIGVEQCAKAILRGIEKQKQEIYVGINAKARAALVVSRFFPVLFNKIVSKADVT
jgi:short-subunit dehydrogenase